jgi:histone acetyltransferase HTATIP
MNTCVPCHLRRFTVFTDCRPSRPSVSCTTLQLFKHYKGQHIICLSDAVLERYEKSKAKRRRRIFKEYLNWRPPSFTRDQLRFGW